MSEDALITLKGEGEVRHVIRTRVRKTCECCGELATKRVTFLMPNARNNPASQGYRGDDISWCSDHEAMRCSAHERDRHNVPDDYRECASFTVGDRFAHMFLEWSEEATSQ